MKWSCLTLCACERSAIIGPHVRRNVCMKVLHYLTVNLWGVCTLPLTNHWQGHTWQNFARVVCACVCGVATRVYINERKYELRSRAIVSTGSLRVMHSLTLKPCPVMYSMYYQPMWASLLYSRRSKWNTVCAWNWSITVLYVSHVNRASDAQWGGMTVAD